MPAIARSTDFRSRRSPSKKSKPNPARCARGLVPRTSARTEKPASTSLRATAEPTNPLAPVTRIFSLLLMRAAVADLLQSVVYSSCGQRESSIQAQGSDRCPHPFVRPAAVGSICLRVCPETLGRITKFSEHEAGWGEAQECERLSIAVLPILGEP